MPILGLDTAQKMNLITVVSDNIECVASITVADKYPSLFSGNLGSLPGVVHLKVDECIEPVVMPSHKVPLSLQPNLKAESQRLTEFSVIAPVDKPTLWVNPMIFTQREIWRYQNLY